MKKIEQILQAGYGHFTITITFRRKQYSAVTTNTQAIDRYRDSDSPAKAKLDGGFTRNQAATALYNAVVRWHNLK